MVFRVSSPQHYGIPNGRLPDLIVQHMDTTKPSFVYKCPSPRSDCPGVSPSGSAWLPTQSLGSRGRAGARMGGRAGKGTGSSRSGELHPPDTKQLSLTWIKRLARSLNAPGAGLRADGQTQGPHPVHCGQRPPRHQGEASLLGSGIFKCRGGPLEAGAVGALHKTRSRHLRAIV